MRKRIYSKEFKEQALIKVHSRQSRTTESIVDEINMFKRNTGSVSIFKWLLLAQKLASPHRLEIAAVVKNFVEFSIRARSKITNKNLVSI